MDNHPHPLLIYVHYLEKFTERELEVFALLIEVIGNQDLADKLCVSYTTVRTHRRNIFIKCGVHTIAELINCYYSQTRNS